MALLQTAAAVDAADLERYCRERLANYKVPKQFVLCAELPLLPIGKVDKITRRQRAARLVTTKRGLASHGDASRGCPWRRMPRALSAVRPAQRLNLRFGSGATRPVLGLALRARRWRFRNRSRGFCRAITDRALEGLGRLRPRVGSWADGRVCGSLSAGESRMDLARRAVGYRSRLRDRREV